MTLTNEQREAMIMFIAGNARNLTDFYLEIVYNTMKPIINYQEDTK